MGVAPVGGGWPVGAQQQSPENRVGHRMGVDLVFSTPDLLLDFIHSHPACVPFPYRYLADHW
jgi:hypothetical protein